MQNLSEAEKSSYLRMQWKGKLMLAIVSAWLICEGEYVCSGGLSRGVWVTDKKQVTEEKGIAPIGCVIQVMRSVGAFLLL